MNTSDGLTESVREIVAATLGRQQADITADSGLSAGSWSSLQHLGILLALSQRFGFDLSPRLVHDLTTVRAMAEYLGERERTGSVTHTDTGGDS
ncbi:acyl carrier protein [Streptomyces sp. NPDC059785]|uniref:acyl carrier protein n=1 Tax=unclassified Streptomyces TaxID=2593676 RepID=UPI003659B9DE